MNCTPYAAEDGLVYDRFGKYMPPKSMISKELRRSSRHRHVTHPEKTEFAFASSSNFFTSFSRMAMTEEDAPAPKRRHRHSRQPFTRVAHDIHIDLSVLDDLDDAQLVDAPLDAFADLCYSQATNKSGSCSTTTTASSGSNSKLSAALLRPTKSSFDDAQSMFSFLSDEEEEEEEEAGHSFSYSSSSSSDEDDESWLESPCTTECIQKEVVISGAKKLKVDAVPAVATEVQIKDGLAWAQELTGIIHEYPILGIPYASAEGYEQTRDDDEATKMMLYAQYFLSRDPSVGVHDSPSARSRHGRSRTSSPPSPRVNMRRLANGWLPGRITRALHA